jgi:hypothetical protein
LGKSKRADSAIPSRQLRHEAARGVAYAVTDEEKLEILQTLPLHAGDRKRQRLCVIVGRD